MTLQLTAHRAHRTEAALARWDTLMFKSLLLLGLGLALVDSVPGRLAAGISCPKVEDNRVVLDTRILKAHQVAQVFHDYQNRSISPWDYSINRDPHRIPQELAEARCRLSGCRNAEGRQDLLTESVPIQQEILVLRKDPRGCPGSFRIEKLLVTVGCTCVTPVVHSQA
ncbi:interleukin-17F-like [Tachyglossus aculeatus]|uniref:interleukin-17F-like n=1 Tax=Tachyglossus aculeatus TaxID=9261 RepID=UPI0018F44EC4|nr:interleukin-17F-like [Tachyglossus aculeatus]